MLLQHIIDMAEPVVCKSDTIPSKSGMDTTTTIMSADDDVFDLKDINGELHHGEGVKIGVDDHIRHIAMHKDFSRRKTDQLLGRNSAVSTSDPEILGLLLNRELLKKHRFSSSLNSRPPPVPLKEIL